jgi:predicted amidohydrolase YtcJ
MAGELTDQAIDLGMETGFGDDRLKFGYLKFFADGGMGARTAWMTKSYEDAAFGMVLTPLDQIEEAVIKADQAGLSVMVHAIGDRANKEIIKMFERLECLHQSRCAIPHRIEHMQMVLPEDLHRLSALKNIAVSCQPNNLSLDISMVEICVGKRAKYVYALKNIMDTQIPVVLNSDAPVADFNPFSGIYSAVTRQRMDETPEGGWYPDQKITREQAVTACTRTPAEISGVGDRIGTITPGKLADLVVLDQDIFKIPENEIKNTQIEMTLFDGRIVYER